jgi:hypothetical protein
MRFRLESTAPQRVVVFQQALPSGSIAQSNGRFIIALRKHLSNIKVVS